jgi:actin-related protein 10
VEVVRDEVVEEIKTRMCFVGSGLDGEEYQAHYNQRHNDPTPSESDFEPPSSDSGAPDSEFSHAGSMSMSEFSVVSNPISNASTTGTTSEAHLEALAAMYKKHSTATDLYIPIAPPSTGPSVASTTSTGTGPAMLIIPGWIRERAFDLLFDRPTHHHSQLNSSAHAHANGGDVDESSLAEVILDAILKVPIDLRKIMVGGIVVSGGGAMVPGFCGRLWEELGRIVAGGVGDEDMNTSSGKKRKRPKPKYDKYIALRSLLPHICILNNPNPSSSLSLPSPSSSSMPMSMSDRAKATSGTAPAFSPSLLPWIGASLAGALKTGGVEVARERWDEEADNANNDEDDDDPPTSPDDDTAGAAGSGAGSRMKSVGASVKKGAGHNKGDANTPRNVLPDWTRMYLPSLADAGGLGAAPSGSPVLPRVVVGA